MSILYLSSMLVALYTVLCLLSAAHAASSAVTVLLQLADQLPPVARVNQPFSWTFSPNTFNSTDGYLNYTTSALPNWLSFQSSDRTFSGTPLTGDVGNPEVVVTAHGSGSSTASSRVTLCVSRDPSLALKLSITDQFYADNPSLSSVFLLSSGSALASTNPTLRIPSKWSFSIGFEYETYTSKRNVHYDVRLMDGSNIPDWMTFHSHQITLNGIAPSEKELSTPKTYKMVLHASDQEGYSAASMPFDLVIASHELSATSYMPTINVTTTSTFDVSLNSPADFAGLLVDQKPLRAQDISNMTMDLSGYTDWLSYDARRRTLSGRPKHEFTGMRPTIPVKITTTFNQTIETQFSMALVPSYFTVDSFPTIYASPKDKISFNVAQYFSNSSLETRRNVNLSMIYEPSDSGNWLNFLEGSGSFVLEGVVPYNYPTTHVLVTFTAYSHITHSTSHATLPIFVATPENEKNGSNGRYGGLSNKEHARLVLALGITFGILGGLCLFGGILAAVRHVARIDDTAVTGEEGRNGYTEKDRKWYGLDVAKKRSEKFSPDTLLKSPIHDGLPVERDYNGIGLGLQRIPERSQSNMNQKFGPSSVPSSGVMSKKEFFAKLKQTVRYVSDRYSPKGRNVASDKPSIIGKPILVKTRTTTESESDLLPFDHMIDTFPENIFCGPPGSNPGSTIVSHSPSGSTEAYSIPQRRGDFGRPKPKTQVHFNEDHQAAPRPMSKASTRSNKSLTVFSQDSPLIGIIVASPESPSPAIHHPRLVPFTNSTRVPTPLLSADNNNEEGPPVAGGGFIGGSRITSQRATIMRVGSDNNTVGGLKSSGSGDRLSMGLRYVQALGGDRDGPSTTISPDISFNVQSSFSSLESSNNGDNKNIRLPLEKRVVVMPGQKFKFLVRIPPGSIAARTQKQGANLTASPVLMPREYNVKIISGQPLSQLHVDLNGIETGGTAEVTGESTKEDVGVVSFGIFAGKDDEVRLATVIIEVAETR